VAMVFQSYALFPHMTVYENMAFGLQLAKTPKAEIDQRVRAASDILQLGPYLGRLPKALSGGQRQRVAIGRAIVREPGVFLFDEPLSNLDAALRVQTRFEIAKIHRDFGRASTVYVTHDQVEAMTLADRILLLNAGPTVAKEGSVAQCGSPLELYQRPRQLFVAGFIGSPSMNFLHGAPVDGGQAFRLGPLTLDLAGYEGGTIGARDKVILGLRPEHLVVQDHAEPGVTIPAVVELDEPMGADSLVWLKAAGTQMSVRVPVERRMAPGTQVHLKVDMSKASLFDASSEVRI